MSNEDTTGSVRALNTYPIKGLSPVSVERTKLRANDGFPGDRLFGFAKANSGFDASDPRPLPKDRFLVLAQQAKLAELATSFNAETKEFSIKRDGLDALTFDLGSEHGLEDVSRFFFEFLDLSEEERPQFVGSQPHRFTDVSVVSETLMNSVSLINLSSVSDFESQIGQAVDPSRFRANILFDGWPPFQEFELLDKTIKVGTVSLKILKRTKRCAATEVNPTSAERDLQLPNMLRKTYGHFDMGVYAQVVSDGTIDVNDRVTIS